MKIRDDNGVPRGIASQARPVRASQPERHAASPSAQPPAEDRVEVSDRARALLVAQGALAQAPEIRTERVEAIKGLIQSGRYQVPSSVLAERILGDGLFA